MTRTVRMRAGWSFTEVLIAGGIFAVLSGSLVLAMVGSRRAEELSRLYMDVLEASASAIHHMRSDLRHLLVLADEPLVPGSFRIAADGTALRMRRLVSGRGAAGWSLAQVDYRLVPASRATGHFHLSRSESGASSGGSGRSGEVVFRSFLVKSLAFSHRDDPAARSQVLQVALEVVADGSRPDGAGPFAGKTFALTHLVDVRQPEQPFAAPGWFAELVPMEAEILSEDVLAAGEPPSPLPEF